jgi:hypothetical protein
MVWRTDPFGNVYGEPPYTKAEEDEFYKSYATVVGMAGSTTVGRAAAVAPPTPVPAPATAPALPDADPETLPQTKAPD